MSSWRKPAQPRNLSIAYGVSPERSVFAKLLPGVMGPGFRQDDIEEAWCMLLPQTPSLRAKRSNPDCPRDDTLDCFVAVAPRNDGGRRGRYRSARPITAISSAIFSR